MKNRNLLLLLISFSSVLLFSQKPYFSKDFGKEYEEKATNIAIKAQKLGYSPKLQLPYLRKEIKYFEEHDDDCNVGFIHALMGQAYMFLQSYDSARIELDIAQEYSNKCPKTAYIEYSMHNTLFWVESDLGNDSLAQFHLHSTLECAKELNDTVKMAYTYGNIGSNYAQKGRFNRAIETFLNAIDLMKERKDTIFLANIYSSISGSFLGLKNYSKSISFADKCIDIASENHKNLKPVALDNKASALINTKKYTEARKCLLESIEINNETGDMYSQTYAYHGLGECYYKERNLDSAMVYLEKAYQLEKELKLPNEQVNSIRSIAQVHFDRKNYLECLKLVNSAIPTAMKLEILDEQYELNQLKLQASLALQSPKDLSLYQDIQKDRDSLYNQQITKLNTELAEKYNTQLKEKENKLLAQKNKANQAKIHSRNILIGVISALFATLLALFFFIQKNLSKEKVVSNLLEEKNDQLLQANKGLLLTAKQKEALVQTNEEEILQLSQNIELLEKERQELIDQAKNNNGNGKKRIRQKSTIHGEILRLIGKNPEDIQLSDIVFLETRDKSVYVHLNDGRKIRQWQALSSFKKLLANHGFIQVQRYYLINFTHIAKQQGDTLTMTNGIDLKITNKFLAETNKQLQELRNSD